MKGIIMAGGEGSRLRPLTCDLPKPMVPVMNKPVMAYSIDLLKRYGIRDIGVTLQYRPEQIMDYFQDGSEYGVRLNYYIEETPLGTAGSVKNTGNFLDQTFVVISGDALTDIDLERAIQFHKKNNSIATLVLKRVEVPLDYGVVVTEGSGRIARFLEKPNWGEVFSDTVNTGIYVLEPKVLDYFEAGRKFDFSQNLFPMLLKDQQPMFGYITDEYWCDIGNSQTYLNAHYDMLSGRINHEFDGIEINKNVFLGKGVEIDESVRLEGPCFIGDYSRIDKDAHIGPYTVIGKHCIIEKNTSIKRSILWNHVIVGKQAEIRGVVLCKKVETQNRVSIFEGAVIGDGCQLNEGVIVKPQVKIWPDKIIEEGSIIQSNIIWGTKAGRYLFGKDGISGSGSVIISPQTISRIGASIGAFFGPGTKTAVSCDSHPGNAMLKHGLISGLLSTGMEIFDLGPLTTPVLRYSVKRLGLNAGIHLFASKEGNINIHIVDSAGSNLPPAAEKKIENLYIRDDYPRKEFGEIKPVNTLYDIPIFYIRSLLDGVNPKVIRNKNYRILVSTSGSRIGSYILHKILNELNCDVVKCKNGIEREMQAGCYDLGCRLDYNGETVILFDEAGNPVSKEMQTVLISLIYLKGKPGGKIVLPCTAPSIIDKLARQYNCSVVRTKSSKQAIMKESMGTDLFLMYFDGIALLTKLLERMALDNASLSDLIDEIPDFYVKEKEIPCPWNKKGTVMRYLIEEETKGEGKVEMFEGVRISRDKGWALILPDSDEPVCRVYSEGYNEEYAEELAAFYEKRIKQIQEKGDEN